MQYKIPVQIENEDPIVAGLSLRQLAIIMIGGSIAYSLFTSLQKSLGTEIALIPAIIIGGIALLIALFRYSEMTFIPFILSFIRFKTNLEERKWMKGIDSFQPIDIGYLTSSQSKKEEKIDFTSKIDKINELENKLNKL
ncbi:PrgI family protein [Candidatus Gracilibacteria bacterium]|nr:PrgI family protein [Candidatus Gracilibacteria bacterium]